MEKKEEKQKDNRFTYSSDEGLKVLSEKEILDSIGKESDKKEVKKSTESNKLVGGEADNMTAQEIADKDKVSLKHIKEQIKIGLKIEREHTDDPEEALEIVMDHIAESSNYYTKLKQMEQSLKDKEKAK